MNIGLDYRTTTPPKTGVFSVTQTLATELTARGHAVSYPRPSIPFRLQNALWPSALRRLAPIDRGVSLDIYHHLWPFGALPHTKHAKRIFTIHDIIPLHETSRTAFSQRQIRQFRHWVKDGIERADQVHFISEFTKHDVLNHYDIADNPTKFSVAHLGVSHDYVTSSSLLKAKLPHELTSIESTLIHNKKTLMEGFFFLLASHLPHKNIQAVIDAYDETFPPLIIAGSDTNTLTTTKRNIVFTGYIEQPTILWLYDNALGFIFPSLHEGFGLPVIEAMMRGCPVIASSSTSIQEIAGNAALLIDAREPEAITHAINELLLSSELQDKLRTAGIVHAQQFTPHAFGDRMLALYQRALAV